jgi:hypothetical protein
VINSNNGNGDEGGGRVTATRATATASATMWAMVMATRLVGDEEGKGKGSKRNDDGNEDILAHSQPTKPRLMYSALLNTLFLLNHSASYLSTCITHQ